MEPAGQPPLQASAPEPGLLTQAGLLWSELRGLAHDHFRLLSLEMRQACSRFVLMVALALVAAALSATAWLGLVATAVFWLVERGFSPIGALLAAVAANIAVAAACVLLLLREGKEMPFAATLRSIAGE